MQNKLRKTLPHLSLEKKVELLSRIISRFDEDYDALLKEFGVPLDVCEGWRRDYRTMHAYKKQHTSPVLADMNVLAMIPARAGSQGLRNKALRELAGKPVIVHTIEACLNSNYIDTVMVTTDSPRIRNVAMAAGAHVPFLRPLIFGDNFVGLDHVLIHATTWLEVVEDYWYDIGLHLSPTYPLRTTRDIDAAIEMHMDNSTSGMISVSPLPRYSGKTLFVPSANMEAPLKAEACFPQKKLYCQSNFMSITCRWRPPGPPIPFLVEPEKNIDIDTIDDFLLCQLMLKHEKPLLAGAGCPDKAFDSAPPDKPLPNLAVVVNMDSPNAWVPWQGEPLACHWIQAAHRAGAAQIIVAGTGDHAAEAARWAGIPKLNAQVAIDEQGFPLPLFMIAAQGILAKEIEHLCVVRANAVLFHPLAVQNFFGAYFRHDIPMISASSPKTHPYWTKRIENNGVIPTFANKIYGQRQLLPEMYVQDGIAAIAPVKDLCSMVKQYCGYVWDGGKSVSLEQPFNILEAIILQNR